ncbi:MAG: PH domain-containing protein [Candidatus Aenigmatarchaeota archaeon]|nr:MAG: PH domain-containing protein [Candidatus Aenigmarchaeota archaeon]
MRGAELGKDFRPAVQLRRLYFIYLFMVFSVFFVFIILPALVFVPPVGVVIFVILVIIFSPVAYWITLYYPTIVYRLTGDEMTWRRGVWFKKTGVVPYNRITNVDIEQGPISRKFGIAAIKIQTAGYSGPNTRSSEIKIEGMENFEELRETIMGLVRGKKPVAVETYDEEVAGSDVLKELVRIRKLLEKKR